jgi:NADPH:quinone reductase-like Zn-dependent oxidoreductase
MRALSPKGRYVAVAFKLGTMFARDGGKKAIQLSHEPNVKDLVYMKELIEAGKVVSVIDRRYPLSEVAEAFRYYAEGHPSGKVVIVIRRGD